jgi:hypothetical protein
MSKLFKAFAPASIWLFVFVGVLFFPVQTLAHCDGMDGPVVKAAQRALETGNVNLILIWVQKKDEGEVRKAFEKTLAVRKLGPEAKALADMYFFETLVRIHRAGEGAPYAGLKPAGGDLGPAIPAVDKALETGAAEPLLKLVGEMVHEGIHEHYLEARHKMDFSPDNVEAGRAYVKAYVTFIHYVERIYQATQAPVHDHAPEPGAMHAEE